MEDYEAKFEEKNPGAWLAYEAWKKNNLNFLDDEDVFENTRDKYTPPLNATNDFDEV